MCNSEIICSNDLFINTAINLSLHLRHAMHICHYSKQFKLRKKSKGFNMACHAIFKQIFHRNKREINLDSESISLSDM